LVCKTEKVTRVDTTKFGLLFDVGASGGPNRHGEPVQSPHAERCNKRSTSLLNIVLVWDADAGYVERLGGTNVDNDDWYGIDRLPEFSSAPKPPRSFGAWGIAILLTAVVCLPAVLLWSYLDIPVPSWTSSSDSTTEAVAGAKVRRRPRKSLPKGTLITVRISAIDRTNKRTLPPGAEMWCEGMDSQYFARGFATSSAKMRVGERSEIYIYPDTRAGTGFAVPVIATPYMNPLGSAYDTIVIDVYDDRVEATGVAVKAANGSAVVAMPR